MKITKKQFEKYVSGWLMSSDYMDDLSIENMKAALHNARVSFEDDQDGIVEYLKREKFMEENKDYFMSLKAV